MWFLFFNCIEQHGQKKDEDVQQSEKDDQGKLLMLRIVWFSIFFNYIEEHGQKDEVDQSKDDGKPLMLRIVWFSIFMFTHTVRIDVIMSSFFVTEKPPTPWEKKLRASMLMCLRYNCY